MKRAHIECDPRDGKWYVFSLAPLRTYEKHESRSEARAQVKRLENVWKQSGGR